MDQPASGMREQPTESIPRAAPSAYADTARIPLAAVDVNPQYQVRPSPASRNPKVFLCHSCYDTEKAM